MKSDRNRSAYEFIFVYTVPVRKKMSQFALQYTCQNNYDFLENLGNLRLTENLMKLKRELSHIFTRKFNHSSELF